MKFVRHFLEEPFTGAPVDVPNWWGLPGDLSVQTTFPKYLGDREMRQSVGAAAAGERRAIYFTQVQADNAADSRVRVNISPNWNGASTGWAPFIGARVSGTTAAWNGYFVDLRLTTGVVALVKGAAGVGTDLATAAFSFVAKSHFNVLFEVVGGSPTTVRAKVWDKDTAEPAGWTVTFSDAVAPIATTGGNVVGILKGAGASPVNVDLAYVCASTGTDTIPEAPLLWADYVEFVRTQDAVRCLLAEIDVLGSTADGLTPLPARLCMSNLGFVSKPSDPRPHICYEEILLHGPKIRRRMAESLVGWSVMSYGDMIVKNEVSNDDLSGRLDTWLRWNWDGRPIRLLVGHPTWRRVDFRTAFLGKVQDVARDAPGTIAVKLRGPEALFQKPVSTALIGGSGSNAFALKPYGLGCYFNFRPLLVDENALTWQLPGQYSLDAQLFDVREGGVSLNKAGTIQSVNAGTDTITTVAPHNLVVGATLYYDLGSTPPAPLGAGVAYSVKTTPTGSSYTLSNTPGGATIDIVGVTAGATYVGRNYQIDDTNKLLKLLGNPTADITVDVLGAEINVSNAIAQILGATGETFKIDQAHNVTVSQKVGRVWEEQVQIGTTADEVITSAGASWCFAREGTYYLKVLDVPGTVADFVVTSDDILDWRVGERWLPANVERLGYRMNHLQQRGGDLLGAVMPAQRDLYGRPYTLAGYTPSDSGLSAPTNHILMRELEQRETLLMDGAETATEVQRLYNLRRVPTGTHFFTTDAWALVVEMGDNLFITHPRDGFTQGKNAIVVGTVDDLDTFKVELEFFSQIQGDWPVVTAAQPFVSEDRY